MLKVGICVPHQRTYFSMSKDAWRNNFKIHKLDWSTVTPFVPFQIVSLPTPSNQIRGDKEIPCSSQTGEEYDGEGEISNREPDAAEKHVHSNLCITDDESSSEETDLLGMSTWILIDTKDYMYTKVHPQLFSFQRYWSTKTHFSPTFVPSISGFATARQAACWMWILQLWLWMLHLLDSLRVVKILS